MNSRKTKILSFMACAMSFIAVAQAQFINFPFYGNCVTNYGLLVVSAPLGGFTNQFLIRPSEPTNFLIGSAASNSAPTIIPLPPGAGLAFSAGLAQTNAALVGSNVTFRFNISIDGTNWSNLNPISATFALTANAVLVAGQKVVAYTNFPRTVLDNARFARLDNIVNGVDQHIYVSNMVFAVFR